MDREKPILECRAKVSMTGIIISALSVMVWLVSFFVSEDKTTPFDLAQQSILLAGALLACWDTIELWSLNRKNIPLLRLYNDHIEYKRQLWRDGYELYYFQDITEVERDLKSITIRLNNGWKTAVTYIDERDFDLAAIIRDSMDAYRQNQTAGDANVQRKFRSVYESGKMSSLNLLKTAVALVMIAPTFYVLLKEMRGSFHSSVKEMRGTFHSSGFAETFLTPWGILVLSAIVIGLCVLLWDKSQSAAKGEARTKKKERY